MTRFVAFMVFSAVSFNCLQAFGQADESRVRSDAGGLYQSPAFGNGSVTGFPNALVIFRNANGDILDRRTVYDWANQSVITVFPPPPNPVLSKANNSGGQITIRFNYSVMSQWHPSLPGGTVEVENNGVLIDRDRLYR